MVRILLTNFRLKESRPVLHRYFRSVSFLVRNNKDVKGRNIFDRWFLYVAFADDTTFFLKNKKSIRELLETFDLFSFSGWRPGFTKYEIYGLGVLKGMIQVVCYTISWFNPLLMSWKHQKTLGFLLFSGGSKEIVGKKMIIKKHYKDIRFLFLI